MTGDGMKVIQDGYKETEIGVLLEDWVVVKINDIANYVGSGTTPRGGSEVYKTEGITFIRSQNVYPNKFALDDVVYIDEETNEKMKRTILQDNDVLLNITGASIGRTAVLPKGFGRGNVNQHVCIIRLNEKFSPIYLSQFLNSNFGRKQIDSYNGGSSREGLNFKQVRDILVTSPPLPEQQRIAEILTATDAHLEKLDAIIADTQLLKKGMMQSLLTRGIGHTEFKDTEIGEIPKAWEVNCLGTIGQFRKGKGIKKDEVQTYGLPCVRYGEIYTTYEHVVRETKSFINQTTAENSMAIENGELIFAGSGETIEDIGKVVVYLNNIQCFVGGDTIIMQPNKNIDGLYLSYFLATTYVTKQKRKLGQGHSVVHLYLEGVKTIKVSIPPLPEQHRIAEILSAIDDRIQLNEKEKEDFTQLKKGLMEQLLTGKIRLK